VPADSKNAKVVDVPADIGGAEDNQLTVEVAGAVYDMLKQIYAKIASPPKTRDKGREEIVSIAITLLHQAIGKSIVLIDPSGRETTYNFWK
jgi:hypothetical protein